MKRFFNGVGGLIVLVLVLAGCLVGGIILNSFIQIGICHYGGGSGYIESPDFMGGIMAYDKMPNYQDWQMVPLGGGLIAGLLMLLAWLAVMCNRAVPKSLLERKIEFSLFGVGMAQVLYGFGGLILTLTETSLALPVFLSVITLGCGLSAATILYRKELGDVFSKVMDSGVKKAKKATGKECSKDDASAFNAEASMTMAEKIKKLYDEGKTDEVLKETEGVADPEIYGLRAWACYRQKEFEKARKEAKKAGSNETALRCLAAIAAYHDKDSGLVKYYTDQLPETPARDNAFMIYAREPSDTTPKEEIMAKALKWMTQSPKDKTNTANLMNNTARWFLAKGQNKEDLVTALGFMQIAIGFYGTGGKNIHHRASAWYWTSVIQEKLMDKTSALGAMEMSVKLWNKQIKTDPANPNFQKSLDGAKTRLKELHKVIKSK